MTLRVDVLRAKSIQAEVSYLNDIKRFSEVKRVEQQLGHAAEKKEKQFWNEAIKTLPANQALRPQAGPQNAAHLERMRYAHGELKDAQSRYQASCQKSQDTAAQLSNSSKRVEILQQLLVKAHRRVSRQNEARVSEDISDIAQSLKTATALRRSSSVQTRPEGGAAVDRESVVNVARGELGATCQPVSVLAPPSSLAQGSVDLGEVNSLRATTTSPLLQVQHVECGTRHNVTELSIRCAVGADKSVSLSLVKREGEGVKVVLNPSCHVAAGVAVREKGVIQARLQALGVKISSLEVESGDPQGHKTSRSRRNRYASLGDDDESLVA